MRRRIYEEQYSFFSEQSIIQEYKLHSEILGLQKQIDLINENVKKSKDQLTQRFSEARKNAKDDFSVLSAIEDAEEDDFFGIGYLNEFLLNANCLMLYAYCEGKFKEICEFTDEQINSEESIGNDRSRDSLKKYYKHLKKLEIDMSESEIYFTRITQQRPVRIAIAHHNGLLQNTNSFPIWNGLVRNGDSVRIEDSIYLIQLLDNMESLFKSILNSLAHVNNN